MDEYQLEYQIYRLLTIQHFVTTILRNEWEIIN